GRRAASHSGPKHERMLMVAAQIEAGAPRRKGQAMTGQAALVTGGARRIGRAIVEDLAANGFAVAVHCNNSRTEADELVARIVGAGGMAATVEADLTDMAAVDGLIGSATKAVGPVALLVNNASTFDADSVLDFDWKTWDRHFALHVKTPALLSRR